MGASPIPRVLVHSLWDRRERSGTLEDDFTHNWDAPSFLHFWICWKEGGSWCEKQNHRHQNRQRESTREGSHGIIGNFTCGRVVGTLVAPLTGPRNECWGGGKAETQQNWGLARDRIQTLEGLVGVPCADAA